MAKNKFKCGLPIIIICVFLMFFLPGGLEGANMQKTYHGTLNVVIATPEILVAATDSRATVKNASGKVVAMEDHHQKLFILPGNIIVTIAGYNRVGLPEDAKEFTAPAAGVILDYIEELNGRDHKPSYDEALTTLIHILTFNLTSVANINLWSNKSITKGPYDFQMIVAGEKDDNFIVSKVILELIVTADGYVKSKNTEIIEKKATSFIYLTAGLVTIADRILKNVKGNPQKDEIEKIIHHVMKKTSEANLGVGGQTQLASLSRKGHIEVDIPKNFPRPKGPSVKYNFVLNIQVANLPVDPITGSSLLIIASKYKNSRITLDGNYFFGNRFELCKIYVNSDQFTFDKSNVIEKCSLHVGPKIDRKSPKFQMLLRRFPPNQIFYDK